MPPVAIQEVVFREQSATAARRSGLQGQGYNRADVSARFQHRCHCCRGAALGSILQQLEHADIRRRERPTGGYAGRRAGFTRRRQPAAFARLAWWQPRIRQQRQQAGQSVAIGWVAGRRVYRPVAGVRDRWSAVRQPRWCEPRNEGRGGRRHSTVGWRAGHRERRPHSRRCGRYRRRRRWRRSRGCVREVARRFRRCHREGT